MTDYIDFIDVNGSEWTRTSRFCEAKETIATQAAVIELLKSALRSCYSDWDGDKQVQHFNISLVYEALAIPTDSTQILDEVRRAERERVAQYVQQGTGDWMLGKKIAAAIRAME